MLKSEAIKQLTDNGPDISAKTFASRHSVLPDQGQEYINCIRRRAKYKRGMGHKLSAVEAHVLRSSSRALFGPSLLRVALDILRVVLRPVPIMIVFALIIAAEATSSAWFSGEKLTVEEPLIEIPPSALALDSPPVSEESLINQDHKPIAEVLAGAFGDTADDELFLLPSAPAPRPLPALGKQPTEQARTITESQQRNRGLVQFISGVIAVYYPGELDSGAIAREIVELSQAANLDPMYVASVIAVESSFRKHARSKVGATGLMQLRPRTAQAVAQAQAHGNQRPELTDPRTNIKLGIAYLKELEAQYRDRTLALAAYNWGPGNLGKVNNSKARIPKSVADYAQKILNQTERWKLHFDKAAQGAAAIEQVRQPLTRINS